MVYYRDCKYLYKKDNGLLVCRNKERIRQEKSKPYCKRNICIYSRE